MRALWCWCVGHTKWVPKPRESADFQNHLILDVSVAYESITLSDGDYQHGVNINYCTRCKRLYAEEF